jgi:hypothetical protein
VQLITAREMGALYPDRAYQRPFTRDELLQMASRIQKEVTFLRMGDRAVSAAEILYVQARAIVEFDENPPPRVKFVAPGPDRRSLRDVLGSSLPLFRTDDIDLKFLYGPSGTWNETIQEGTFSWKRWVEACRDFLDEAEDLGRIPAVIWVAGKAVAPEDFAATLGWVFERLSEQNLTSWTGTEFPGLREMPLKKGNFTAGKYVAEDGPGLWGWVIFPPGLRCPKMMELGRLQAWTIKPAILVQP